MEQVQVQHQPAAVAANGPDVPPASGPGGVNSHLSTSLYVGDLEFDVSDSQLSICSARLVRLSPFGFAGTRPRAAPSAMAI